MSDIKKYEPLWGAWYVESLLGKGSFGEVYKIRREAFGRTHYSALKRISLPRDEEEMRQMRSEMDEAAVGGFLQALLRDLTGEIDLMSELRGNSNIVSFEDYIVMDMERGSFGQGSHLSMGWDILIRMELLESLPNRVAEAPLPLSEILKMGMHMCRALELCAVKNIIHRDIKPENIFISQYGEYKLGDFGLARQLERTMAGLSKKGTYTYMAPEVFRGDAYGPDVDIYSLGIVLYRFLNQSRIPFLPDFPQSVLPDDRNKALQRRMRGERVPNLKGVSHELNALVLKACAYNREERFRSPSEMREALENVAKSQGCAFMATEISHGADTHVLPHAIQQKARSGQNPDVLSGQTERLPQHPQEYRQNPAPERRKTGRPRLAAILSFCGVLAVAAIIFISLWGGGFLGRGSYGNTVDSGLSIQEKENLHKLLYHEIYEIHETDSTAVSQTNIFDIQARNNEYTVKFNIITGRNGEEFIENASAVVKKSAENSFGFNILSLQRDLPLPIFTAATASSTLAPQETNHYYASNVLNSDKDKPWVEGADGSGIGEWIEISSDSVQKISGISLLSGYFKSSDSYKKNNRPQHIRIGFSDGTSIEKTLSDEQKKQVITFDKEIPTTFVRITILGVFKGTHYDDTCISNITVF